MAVKKKKPLARPKVLALFFRWLKPTAMNTDMGDTNDDVFQ